MDPSLLQKIFIHCACAGGLFAATSGCQQVSPDPPETLDTTTPMAAVQRGLDYLAREVPLWRQENGCFSCHHNGDGARVLYQAAGGWPGGQGLLRALPQTTAWLTQPHHWDDNQGEPGFSDKRLARIQFALTLMEAWEMGEIARVEVWQQGVTILLAEQESDGSWGIEPKSGLGSPATYGTHLATALCRRALMRSNLESAPVRQAGVRARQWLADASINNHLEAAAILLGLPSSPHGNQPAEAVAQRQRCLDILWQGQSSDGGWGPYPDAPAEPFDTAVVLLALQEADMNEAHHRALQKGRSFLIQSQWPEGDWTESTRPPGGESYAQRVSTTAWVLQALMAMEKSQPSSR